MPFRAKKLTPIDTSTLAKLGQGVVNLSKYTEDEFGQVAKAFQSIDPDTILYSAPPRPRMGTIVYADGTHWNPGSGEGFYQYTSGGLWVPLFTSGISGISIGGVVGTSFTLNGPSGITIVGSDIRLFQASTSQFGAVKPDGTTITASGGVLSSAIVPPSPITNVLGADVSLTNVANYFDGPTIAQGSVGTWWVSGSVTLTDTAAADFQIKLWDGTTVIASNQSNISGNNQGRLVALSGFITSPAGNLRISVKDITTINGKIKFNMSGNSKDSIISAYRIA